MTEDFDKMTLEEEMTCCALERTEASREEALEARIAVWHTTAAFAAKGVAYCDEGCFNDARQYFEARYAALTRNAPIPDNAYLKAVARQILGFRFVFTYTEYDWNGESNDPTDDNSFFTGTYEDECGDLQAQKLEVIAAARKYILAGGAWAREVNSSSYPIWRDLLKVLQFEFNNFADETTERQLEGFFESLGVAQRLLWADRAIAAVKPPKAPKAMKAAPRGKKRTTKAK